MVVRLLRVDRTSRRMGPGYSTGALPRAGGPRAARSWAVSHANPWVDDESAQELPRSKGRVLWIQPTFGGTSKISDGRSETRPCRPIRWGLLQPGASRTSADAAKTNSPGGFRHPGERESVKVPTGSVSTFSLAEQTRFAGSEIAPEPLKRSQARTAAPKHRPREHSPRGTTLG